MLNNKKILFIGPAFHDYHKLIIDNLTLLGAEVAFFPEKKLDFMFKIINNFYNKKLKKHQHNHYSQIFKQFDVSNFDYLFIIRGYMLSSEFLIEFKRRNLNARVIMYQWDSNKTNPFAHLLNYFDATYSFDFEDCRKYPSLKYLPLFFSDDISKQNRIPIKDKKYDFFFMGWYFPERYEAVMKFNDFAIRNNLNIKCFLYLPSTSYIKERLKGKNVNTKIVSSKPMDRKEYLSILNNSRVMVDVSSPNQTGLSMRVIEALASDVKILTNNCNIKNDAQIFSEDYISFLNENDPAINESFLNSKTNNSAKLFSLKEWLINIFSID
jgi:hypothetical protein